MKKNIAFYYLSDAIGPFFFFWFIIRRIALDKTMNKKRKYRILLFKWYYNEEKREYCILLFKIYKGTLMELSSTASNKIGHE